MATYRCVTCNKLRTDNNIRCDYCQDAGVVEDNPDRSITYFEDVGASYICDGDEPKGEEVIIFSSIDYTKQFTHGFMSPDIAGTLMKDIFNGLLTIEDCNCREKLYTTITAMMQAFMVRYPDVVREKIQGALHDVRMQKVTPSDN